MKRSTFFILLSWFVLASCLKEENIDLAKPSTFTRYYSDGYNNEAVAVEQTKDGGFIILANATYQNTDADPAVSNIMVMKTDAYGNLLWREYYPKNFVSDADSGYVANSLSFLPDSSGYFIVGQKIEVNSSSQELESDLLVMTINDIDGSVIKGHTQAGTSSTYARHGKVFAAPSPRTKNWNGRAGFAKSDNNFVVLASDADQNNIILTELNSNLDSIWSKTYSQGATSLTARLFYDNIADFVYWGGHGIQSGSTSDLFLTKSKRNSTSTETGLLPIGSSVLDEFALDVCRYGNNFAFTGYSNESGGNIIYYITSGTGAISQSGSFNLEIFGSKVPDDGNTQFEEGKSIIATRDGGLIILGTIETYAGDILGRGDTDMILMKINGFGEKQWSLTHGSKDADDGNSIRQTSDDGFIVLGTTRLGGLRTVTLIKTDAKGEVD